MAGDAPSATFHDAASYLTRAPSLSKVSSKVKLELYGLYKHLTVSPSPNTSRPSLFDITGRAKWDAWKSTCNTYGDRYTDVEIRYLDIARQLGWKESACLKPQTARDTGASILEQEDDSQDESGNIWGMGNAVSSFEKPSTEYDSTTIHGLALSNDVDGFKSLLLATPDVNLDDQDEFGYTPLHLAADRGNSAVVELLLRHGADHTLKDPDGLTALELAQVAGHDDVKKLLTEGMVT